jgi:cytochrome c oxidase subunit II
MSIAPPAERLWWKQPMPRVEVAWIAIAFLWGLVMFFMMIYWHAVGRQNLSNLTYRTTPDVYLTKANAMVETYTVRQEAGFPVVHPPPGSDVYLVARIWNWWPIFELEKNQSYRLHLSSMDYQHGFSLQPVNINIQVHPGYEHVLTITPNQTGQYGIVCNEYCGLGHHTMIGRIYVIDSK